MIKCSASLAFYHFFPNPFKINSIKHEHSCKILLHISLGHMYVTISKEMGLWISLLIMSVLLVLVRPSDLWWARVLVPLFYSESTNSTKQKVHVDSQYSKTCLKQPLKKDKTNILITNGSLMKVESIAECSPWSILQYC